MLFSAFLKPSFYLSCWLYASVRSEKESVAESGHRASVVEPPWFVESERETGAFSSLGYSLAVPRQRTNWDR